jgi:hypothetical protein
MNFRVFTPANSLNTVITRIIPVATEHVMGTIALTNHLGGTAENPQIRKPGVVSATNASKLELLGFIENSDELAITEITMGKLFFHLFTGNISAQTFKTPAKRSPINVAIYIFGAGSGVGTEKTETSVTVSIGTARYSLIAKSGLPPDAVGGKGGEAAFGIERGPFTEKISRFTNGGNGSLETGLNGSFLHFSLDEFEIFMGGGGGGSSQFGGGCGFFGGGGASAASSGTFTGPYGGSGADDRDAVGFGGGLRNIENSHGGGGGGAIFAMFKNVPASTTFNIMVPMGPGRPGVIIDC